MRIQTIFLDLDDVLNNFTMAALRYVGCKGAYDPAWGFDIVKAANELHPEKSFTVKEFWDLIDRDFWKTVRKSAPADSIIRMCCKTGGRNYVYILTATTGLNPDAVAGKIEWINRNLPKWLSGQVIHCREKYFLAGPGTVLIDDNDYNVKAFRSAGGQTILVPRPWNSLHEIGHHLNYVPDMLGTLL